MCAEVGDMPSRRAPSEGEQSREDKGKLHALTLKAEGGDSKVGTGNTDTVQSMWDSYARVTAD